VQSLLPDLWVQNITGENSFKSLVSGRCAAPGCWPGDGGDWRPWQRWVTDIVSAAPAGVAFDVWNEPGISPGYFWNRNFTQYLKMWSTAVIVARRVRPAVKVIGPSTSTFDLQFLRAFLTSANATEPKTLPNVLSWHEFSTDGKDIPGHVDAARQLLAEFEASETDISINEMVPMGSNFNPAVHVSFFANLERAAVGSACHSCWASACPPGAVPDALSGRCYNCGQHDTKGVHGSMSLDGLLTSDGKELPRSVWWAYKAYAAVNGTLLAVNGSQSADGVAAISADGASISVVVGKLGAAGSTGGLCGPAGAVTDNRTLLKLEGVPTAVVSAGATGATGAAGATGAGATGSARVTGAASALRTVAVAVARIPDSGAAPLRSPVVTTQTASVLSHGRHGMIDVALELNDGEVALVVVGARAEAVVRGFAVPPLARSAASSVTTASLKSDDVSCHGCVHVDKNEPARHQAAGTIKTADQAAVQNASSIPSSPPFSPPTMGWMSWEVFRCDINCTLDPARCIREQLYTQMTDALADGGFLAAGYDQVSIDDCWQHNPRAVNGLLQPNGARFGSSLKPLADYMHTKGVRLGIYTDAGVMTCMGYPGSQGYETQDAKTFAGWGVDYIKMDACKVLENGSFINGSSPAFGDGWRAMGEAIAASGRHMTFSCSWPAALGDNESAKPFGAMAEMGCDSWRNWHDIQCEWGSVAAIIDHWGDYGEVLQAAQQPTGASGGRHYHDMDMLIIGNGCITHDEERTQMAIWAISASPIIMGNDLRSISATSKAILLTAGAIAVSQDGLGRMGTRLAVYTKDSPTQVWTRQLENGDVAVACYNKGGDPNHWYANTADITFAFRDVGLRGGGTFSVVDLWVGTVQNVSTQSFTAKTVPHHGTAFFRVSELSGLPRLKSDDGEQEGVALGPSKQRTKLPSGKADGGISNAAKTDDNAIFQTIPYFGQHLATIRAANSRGPGGPTGPLGSSPDRESAVGWVGNAPALVPGPLARP
jgi:hypothetical protein